MFLVVLLNFGVKNQVPQGFFKRVAGDLMLVPLMSLMILYFVIH